MKAFSDLRFAIYVFSAVVILAAVAVRSRPATATNAAVKVNGIEFSTLASAPLSLGLVGTWADNSTRPIMRWNDGSVSRYVVAASPAPATTGQLGVYNSVLKGWYPLAPGTDGQCLTADSTNAYGLKWATCNP